MKTTIYKAVFSPTGGTARAALFLSDALTCSDPEITVKELDFTQSAVRAAGCQLSSEDILIAATPVYGGQLPPVEGLFNHLKGNQTPCILMAAYGNRHYDDCLAQLKEKLSRQGFVCMAAIACVIPHIFSDKVGANRPDAADQVMIAEFAASFWEKYRSEKAVSGVLKEASVPGNPSPEQKPLKNMPKFLNSDRCVNCKLCAISCPVGAINPETLAINPDLCINCMRCSRVCPANARSFNADAAKNMLESKCLTPRTIEWFL